MDIPNFQIQDGPPLISSINLPLLDLKMSDISI